MKVSTYYIVLNIRTGSGFECVGKFCLGNNRKTASSIFDSLKGNRNVNEQTILTLDLMELVNELPLSIQMITCTLEELAENCKIITRETFKRFNVDAKLR